MHIWTILWQSVVIFLCIYLPVKYIQVKKAKRLWREQMQKKIDSWELVPVPPNEKYIVVRAKELHPENIIIYSGNRFQLNQVSFGSGAGSLEFGEYILIKGSFVNSNPTDPYPEKSFWLYRESPTIKCVNE